MIRTTSTAKDHLTTKEKRGCAHGWNVQHNGFATDVINWLVASWPALFVSVGKSYLYVIDFIDADTYVLHRHCGDPVLKLGH